MGINRNGVNFPRTVLMFLQLNHQQLKVFEASKEFVSECYRISRSFPDTEKFGMVSQIRRAALSLYLNIAEGCSRKSEIERKRFYEIARGSIVEIDALLDVAVDLIYIKREDLRNLEKKMINCFKMISGLLRSNHK
jgi:four helix bundle protein